LIIDFVREKQRSSERDRTFTAILSEWRSLPEANSLAEEDYQKMITALGAQMERLSAEADAERQDMLDYFTVWVHEIKTPIAVMRLKLSDDTPEHHALAIELQRIERYVDMVLQYIRIGSETNDLVIQECSLDELIRESVRKLAPQFVEKRLRLVFVPTEASVVTDAKWFACILDQLLSNAVKYTPEGAVTIGMQDGRLMISDTGIGIAPQDLPRIFEKGYTGINGRLGQKSSGLGLYLAKKAADLLSIPLTVESREGEGSAFTLDLRQKGCF
jgi:signal transduction histidine kinase